MPGRGETLAKKVDTSKKDESEKAPLDLYIGIFFDGTNNNKYQTMLGKMFRKKEIFEKAKQRHPDPKKWQYTDGEGEKSINSIEDLLKLSRAEVEKRFPGAFTRSELEFLYFGYGSINDTSDKTYDTFIEKKSEITLAGETHNELSARPDDNVERGALHHAAKDLAARNDISSDDDRKIIESYKGAAAQNVTYTNVAILESLYNCENKKNNKGEITKRHVSIYVEGSGADMQFEASTSNEYKATIGLAGLGLGTGPTGVVSKIRKASSIVQRLIDQYKCMSNVEVKYHFDLFGFSRGSTCARVMAYLINPDPNTDKAYTGENKINNDDYLLLTSREKEFLPIDDKTIEKEIRFMGLFDTVSSIGVKDEDSLAKSLAKILDNAIRKVKDPQKKDINTIWNSIKPYINPPLQYIGLWADYHLNTGVLDKMGEAIGNTITYLVDTKLIPIINRYETYVKSNAYRDKGTEDISVLAPKGKTFLHENNVKDYGLWATKLAKNVVHVCAMDEVRQNFALVDIESSLKEGKEKSIEVFIPGCHTDIGGGASIGMEGEKIINKDSNRYLTSYYVHSKSWLEKDKGDLLKPINVKSLKEIGWLNPDSKTPGFFTFSVTGRVKLDEDETYYCDNTVPANVIIYRHVTPGYSNIALNFIKEKSIGNPFSEIPKAYQVPKDLNDLYRQLKTIDSSGRYFVYPNKLEQYSELRRKFIHFSFNEQWLDVADNALVNGPEYTTIDNSDNGHIKVISRIIYPGVADADPMHMFDYEEGRPSQIQEEDNPPQSGLHPLLSGDYSGFEEYDTSLDRLVFNPA